MAERAGVSAGAQAYHFPRRVDLVAAAAEHLVERRIEDSQRRAKRITGPPEQRLRALLDLMWADFASPIFAVFVKLWVAASDEPELYERLVAGERRIARAITGFVTEAVGEFAAGDEAEGRVLLIFSACRGLALTEQFEPRERRRRDPWPKTARRATRAARAMRRAAPITVAAAMLVAAAPAAAAELRSFELPSRLVDPSAPGGALEARPHRAEGQHPAARRLPRPSASAAIPVLWLLHGANGGTDTWIPGIKRRSPPACPR